MVSTRRSVATLLSGLLAIATLGLATQPALFAQVPALAASALFVSLAMALLGWTGALLQGVPASDALGLGRGTLGPLRTAALVVGTIGLSQLLNALLSETGLRQQSVLEEIDCSISNAFGGEYALLLVLFAIGPGIAEEILFRGLILRSVAGVSGSAWALLSSSLLFSLAHPDLAQSVAAAVLGLYLGAIALKGDSIRACVVCHIANNVAALLWVSDACPATGLTSALMLAASAAGAAVGLVALATARRRDTTATP